MTYEIKSPDMIRSRDIANTVIDGLLGAKMDVKTANALTGATNNLIRSFSNDLRARLALPDLIEAEAKLLNARNAPSPELDAARKRE